MKEKQFNQYRSFIVAGLAMAVGASIVKGIWYIPIIAVVLGMASMSVLKSRVTEVIEDERIQKTGEKAAYRAYQIFVGSCAAIAIGIMTLPAWFPGMEQAAYVLAYSAMALMILYSVLYTYYDRKGV